MGHPRLFVLLSFQTLQFFQQMYEKNVHRVYIAGIRAPERESPPITTRQGSRC